MLEITQMNAFKRDVKLMRKRNSKMVKLLDIVETLARSESLPRKYKDHALTGNWTGRRECHIEPDWLLIYRLEDDRLILERTGTHSDLFD